MSYQSKIVDAATRRGQLGSFGDLGPGSLAVDEWAAAGLDLPDVPRMRRYRLDRLRGELARLGYGAALLTDPMNVRYATDSTNMQLWAMHNLVRYAFVAVDGPVVVFDFHGSGHLSDHLELVDAVRPAQSWFYFHSGPHSAAAAESWATEIADLMRDHAPGELLAVDKLDPLGAQALDEFGVVIVDGQAPCELARAIKSSDEVAALRCVVHTAERGIAAMHRALRHGISEQELWAQLHAENIRRGGEWIETRLLASGQRTNPWFQECSSRVIEHGDVVAFDTDLIGPYGYCADLSRTWICGDVRPTVRQRDLYKVAAEQIAHNTGLLRPGVSFFDFAAAAFDLPDRFRANRYSSILHGVGLCDEYPAVVYPEDAAFAYDGEFAAGMMVCVESYVGEVGGSDGIKLEEQVLISETGVEQVSTYPLDAAFLR
ncbi:Xaa-Pro peptidase family protein [soil metagenome]